VVVVGCGLAIDRVRSAIEVAAQWQWSDGCRRSGVGFTGRFTASGAVDRAGAEAAGVMPQWLGLRQNWVCGLCLVETDAVASSNESDGLFADRSMRGWGRSIERRWS
jgi:hypothetical protein